MGFVIGMLLFGAKKETEKSTATNWTHQRKMCSFKKGHSDPFPFQRVIEVGLWTIRTYVETS
jgi:hypothetical protein